MDRLTQLRGEAGAGSSRDSSLDSTTPSEAFITASDSKYFSLSEEDSTFDISPIKDVSLASAADPDKTIGSTDDLITNLSPIPKKNDLLDSYKIGKQIEAANILSGGVQIFDDNDNSYDGNELIIDDNMDMDDKSSELKLAGSGLPFQKDEVSESVDSEIASKDTEVVLQIDGKNVNAIDIGNGLYLYRKEGEEELAAVQIIDDDQQQPSFKFLKVRENAEGNLEVYEEIEIEVPKEVPAKEGKVAEKNPSHVPIKDKHISGPTTSKVVEKKVKLTPTDEVPSTSAVESVPETIKESQLHVIDTKNDTNVNGKLMKINETRKSPVIHSTPNKEGIPLTKTMVDQQLHPSRHLDNVKTIELHTDSAKTKIDSQVKCKETEDKSQEASSSAKDELDNNIATQAKENQIETDLPETQIVEAKSEAHSDKTKETESSKTETESKIENILDKNVKEVKEVTKIDNQVTIQETETPVSDVVISLKPKLNELKIDTDPITESVKKVESDIKDSITASNVANLSISKIELTKEKDSISISKSAVIEDSKINVKYNKINVDNKPNSKEPLPIKDLSQNKIDTKIGLNVAKLEIKSDEISKAGSSSKEIPILESVAQKIDLSCIKNVSKSDVVDKVSLNVKVEKKKDLPSAVIKQATVSKLNLDVHKTVAKDKQVETAVIATDTAKKVERLAASVDKNITNISLDVSKSKSENVVNINKDDVKSCAKINPLQDVTHEKTVSKFSLGDRTKLESNLKVNKASTVVENVNLVAESKAPLQKSTDEVDHAVPLEISIKHGQGFSQPIKCHSYLQAVAHLCEKEDNKVKAIGVNKELAEPVKKEVQILPIMSQVSAINVAKKYEISSKDMTSTFIPKLNQRDRKTDLIIKPLPKNVHETAKCTQVTKAQDTPDPKLSNQTESKDKVIAKEPVDVVKPQINAKIELPIKDKIEQPKPLTTKKPIERPPAKNTSEFKNDLKNEISITNVTIEPVNNNHAPVPFGKWTEVNRQAFLNKIKETKVPTATTNTKSLKQPNDLNRRDVLQKIDSQRQNSNAKVQEMAALNRLNVKNESKQAFSSNVANVTTAKPSQELKLPVKAEVIALKNKPIPAPKKPLKPETTTKQEAANILKDLPNTTFSSSTTTKTAMPRKEINNQALIDKTIEGIINRSLPAKPEETKVVSKDNTKPKTTYTLNFQPKEKHNTLDAIEMKMNELHGIPFVERPPHELPKVYNYDIKTYSKEPKAKVSKIPNLLPYAKNQPAVNKDLVEIDSEEEIIEHVPVTGDIDLNKKEVPIKVAPKLTTTETTIQSDASKKEPIITEKDFDKFARRNSFTYENCLTVNFEGNQPHNVIQSVMEKDIPVKKYSRNELLLAEAKNKSTNKHMNQAKASNKIQITSKLMPVNDEALNKNYQSKLQMAYQSALTAKKQLESPITIIEDKPVKVVFVDSNPEFALSQLNVQGTQLPQSTRLSPAKKQPEPDTLNTNDSVDSDMLEVIPDGKSQEDNQIKTKHLRKQVLTPVDTPDLELIDADDLNISIDSSPKKKRKTEDVRVEKSPKNVVPKKSYLLGRNAGTANEEKPAQDISMSLVNAAASQINLAVSAVSAIDNLVKAAELIESQPTLNTSTDSVVSSSESQQTPLKRGRGRPRKYPLPEEGQDKPKVPSPQKKPRLIDAKKPKQTVISDDDSSDDELLIRENWTMGKINENIVCPICSKLFRSENVVFKHVKHCTGPSPNRSDSDKRSSRRLSKYSQDSDSKSSESLSEEKVEKVTPSKATARLRKSKESVQTEQKDEIIVIEDSPVLQKPERNEPKQHISRKQQVKLKIQPQPSSLACETCGKAFRQLSYLVSHRLLHKKEHVKKPVNGPEVEKSVFSCEVCKKEFRKLHHLVNHRSIHNPTTVPTKAARKSSVEYSDNKSEKYSESSKPTDDQSAAFRCEPCDKSFRKLHHLVEHRETHDGINRQKNNAAPAANVEKPAAEPPQCDICKKTFRKLHHLIEHKEQHVENSSENSDDKSVKSSLSTRDIIHECSLCYMVFPNEHSLTKHSVFCQRKKRQSTSKQAKQTEGVDASVEIVEENKSDTTDSEQVEKVAEQKNTTPENVKPTTPAAKVSKSVEPVAEKVTQAVAKVSEKRPSKEPEVKPPKEKATPNKRERDTQVPSNIDPEIPDKIRKVEEIAKPIEVIEIVDTPKKKTPLKEKVASTVTKRKKSGNLPPPVVDNVAPSVESSDDDEVRYMLNPNYKETANVESKVFMKVRAQKRNSLQIERPNSKDLVKRRTSLQHPPKISRLKQKPEDAKVGTSKDINTITKTVVKTANATNKTTAKQTKLDPVSSSESEDSDVKYSFPKTVEKTPPAQEVKEVPMPKKKPVVLKRKSLTGLAKRKTIGTFAAAKKSSPEKQIKRRTAEVDHRCDCGELFSSAVLLSQHTSVVHTPPRIRRRRSPPPDIPTKNTTKPKQRRSLAAEKPKPTNTRKSSTRSDTNDNKTTKKTVEKSVKTPRKSMKTEIESKVKTTVKVKRNTAHRGVPVPEKMRKLFEKLNKKDL